MRPPNKERGRAQEKARPAQQGGYDNDYLSDLVLLSLSLSGRLRLVTEDEAHALLAGRVPEIAIRLGMPQIGWRGLDDWFVGWREMTRELGHYAVIVPGKDLPVWLPYWSFDPASFVAAFAGMNDRELQRAFPGFSRAMWEYWTERNRAHRERQDARLAEWLADLAAEVQR